MKATSLIVWLGAGALLGAVAAPAAALAARLTSSTDSVIYIDGNRTRAAFLKGQPLVETETYKVHASRRTAAGMAEIHTRDTDIVYVLEGTATLVTGGRATDAKEIAPHELRGSAIEGGFARKLEKGDVVIVPNGVPHWFSEVQGPFLYYVVKTTATQADGGGR